MTQPRLSALVLAQNVEKSVGRCLDSLAFCDDILVIDAESEDTTVALARERGARVVTNPWPGFAAQRAFGLEQVRGDWILICDSDEEVTPELAAAVRAAIEHPSETVAWRIRRRSQYMGRWMNRGPWSRDYQTRLFRRDAGRVSDSSVHEGIVTDGPTGVIEAPLLHYTHTTIADSIARINRYTTLEAVDRHGRRRIRVADVLTACPVVFTKYYLLRGCWREGMPGFLLSATTGMYKSLLYLKIFLLQRSHRSA